MPHEPSRPLGPSASLGPGDLLAADTTEAIRVVRRGDWVFKFLKPHNAFPPRTAPERLRQIRLRVRESRLHAELNPLAYDEEANCLVSRFVEGRRAGTRQCNDLLGRMIAERRGYILDLNPFNVLCAGDRLVIVDFEIAESHPDWLAAQNAAPRSDPFVDNLLCPWETENADPLSHAK
jgi:hypothetical protein